MDKMIRELDDIMHSQTAVLKKLAQLEAENINLGNSLLEKRLPAIHEKVDAALTDVLAIQADFTEARAKFITDNKLDVALPETDQK